MKQVAVLVLAAGGSARLGTPKQLLDWGGRPLLQYVLDAVAGWPAGPVLVVLGAEVERILESIDFGDASVVINPQWEEGLASSLRVGLDALSRETKCDGVLVALGDQPEVSPEVVVALIEAFRAGHRDVVVPKYRYTRGNPVLLGAAVWGRIMSLEGDEGAQRLLQAHPEWVDEVWFDHLPPRDIDTAADVEELQPKP